MVSPVLEGLQKLEPNPIQFLNLLTFGLWGKIGRLTHYAFDAVLSTLFLPAATCCYLLRRMQIANRCA